MSTGKKRKLEPSSIQNELGRDDSVLEDDPEEIFEAKIDLRYV